MKRTVIPFESGDYFLYPTEEDAAGEAALINSRGVLQENAFSLEVVETTEGPDGFVLNIVHLLGTRDEEFVDTYGPTWTAQLNGIPGGDL